MKNKIYPFLLGLSCIVIVALVSFKSSEKAVEKEQMIIFSTGGAQTYNIYISTEKESEHIKAQEPNKGEYQYTVLLNKVQEYQKLGWVVINTSSSVEQGFPYILYTLERQK